MNDEDRALETRFLDLTIRDYKSKKLFRSNLQTLRSWESLFIFFLKLYDYLVLAYSYF